MTQFFSDSIFWIETEKIKPNPFQPRKEFDLDPIYKEIIKKDRIGTWFLHISHNMLLNSSAKNPFFIATKLSLKEVIEIIKSI